MHIIRILVFSIFAFCCPAHADSNECKALSAKLSHNWGWDIPVPCYCGRDLANLELTPPAGTTVKAVCGLRHPDGKLIDLVKEKMSLDRHDDLPEGSVYLSGQIKYSGAVYFEPGDAGDLVFTTGVTGHPKTPVFRREYFQAIKLGSTGDYRKLGMSNPYSEGKPYKCWSKKVTLKIVDPVVHLSATDFGGTYATDIAVLKMSAPKEFKCYQ